MRPTVVLAIILAALAASTEAQENAPLLRIGESEEYGAYLVARDFPVYAFVTTDVRGGDDLTPLRSCTQRCLEDWPLVTAPSDNVSIGEGVAEGLAETIDWKGQNVVIFDANALFHYFRDEPGEEPRGQAVHTWGGWWYLVRPDGTLIVTGIGPEPPIRQDG